MEGVGETDDPVGDDGVGGDDGFDGPGVADGAGFDVGEGVGTVPTGGGHAFRLSCCGTDPAGDGETDGEGPGDGAVAPPEEASGFVSGCAAGCLGFGGDHKKTE